MIPYSAAIFDFDGTLVESGPGIFRIIHEVLRRMGLPDVDNQRLRAAVGPILRDALIDAAGVPPQRSQEACDLYHQIYAQAGDPELRVYPGVLNLLDALRQAGIHTAIATAKAQTYATAQAEQLQLLPRLDLLIGAQSDLGRSNKADSIRHIVATLGLPADQCVMIGDRYFDLCAAQEAGVAGIAVLYGYGSYEELAACAPAHIVSTVAELGELLLGKPLP